MDDSQYSQTKKAGRRENGGNRLVKKNGSVEY